MNDVAITAGIQCSFADKKPMGLFTIESLTRPKYNSKGGCGALPNEADQMASLDATTTVCPRFNDMFPQSQSFCGLEMVGNDCIGHLSNHPVLALIDVARYSYPDISILAELGETACISYTQLSLYSDMLAASIVLSRIEHPSITAVAFRTNISSPVAIIVIAALRAGIPILPLSENDFDDVITDSATSDRNLPPASVASGTIISLYGETAIYLDFLADYISVFENCRGSFDYNTNPFLNTDFSENKESLFAYSKTGNHASITHVELVEAIHACQQTLTDIPDGQSPELQDPVSLVVQLLARLTLGCTLPISDTAKSGVKVEAKDSVKIPISSKHPIHASDSVHHPSLDTCMPFPAPSFFKKSKISTSLFDTLQLEPSMDLACFSKAGVTSKYMTDLPDEIKAIYAEVLGVDVSVVNMDSSFLAVGGDSISAIKMAALAQRTGKKLTPSQVLSSNSLGELVELVDNAGFMKMCSQVWPPASLPYDAIQEIRTKWVPQIGFAGRHVDILPCSPLQAGMISATLCDHRAYLYQFVLKSKLPVNIMSLQSALSRVIQSRDIFRTTFVSTAAAGLCQVVCPTTDQIEVISHAGDIYSYLAADKELGFGSNDVHWLRMALIQDNLEQYIVLTIHHALFDGWSLPHIMSDLLSAYIGIPLIQRPPYSAFIDYIDAQDRHSAEVYWSKYMKGVSPTLLLNRRWVDKCEESGSYKTINGSIPLCKLQKVSQDAGVTVAVLLKAAWALTLRKYTRSNDIVFGQAVSGRGIPVSDAESIIGLLLNTVPCRVVINDSVHISSLLASLQADHIEMLPYYHASLVDVRKWSNIQGDMELFNTAFIFENMPAGAHNTDGFEYMENMAVNGNTSDFDMEVVAVPRGSNVEFSIKCSEKVPSSQALSILSEYDFTLATIVDSLQVETSTVESLWQLSSEQMKEITRLSFGGSAALPYELVHHGFESQAKLNPDRCALEFVDEYLTYGELDSCGNALAAQLLDRGVCVGSRVAVIMQRCSEYTISLLAILKAGATIVPVDATFPPDRIRFMLDDSSASLVLSTSSEAECLSKISTLTEQALIVDVKALRDAAPVDKVKVNGTVCGTDAMVVVYTSGSTGVPKGVLISHISVSNVTANATQSIGITENVRVAQFNSIGFDLCIWETWGTLCNGGTLVIRQEDAFKTLESVASLIITPTGLQCMGSPLKYPNLKSIFVTGEHCPRELKDLWAPFVTFVNGGGPSEGTILATMCLLEPDDPIYYGRPIPNVSCMILDSSLRQVPLGVVGEMYLGGVGVSTGYINRPELTAERFTPDPFTPRVGNQMFRTGDLGRMFPDGNFEIIGRLDDMVKLKGYRIELDEVAAALSKHAHVTSASVILVGNSHLIGFITPADVDVDDVRQTLSSILPSYMIPAVIVCLDEMPTNVNGKTDKKALAKIDVTVSLEKLCTGTEHRLAEIWSKILGVRVDSLYKTTSFFEIGGNSISIIKAVSACQYAGMAVTVAQLFKFSTLAALASAIDVAASKKSLVVSSETLGNGTRPIRIVCLHGFSSCATHMEFQMSGVRAALGDKVEFLYIDAPFQVEFSPLAQFYDNSVRWYEWLPVAERTAANMEKTIALISKRLGEIGPIDGILGFSQGAIITHLLDKLAMDGAIPRVWDFSILCSGIIPSADMIPSDYKHMYSERMSVPCIQMYSSDELEGGDFRLDQLYSDDSMLLIEHSAGHDIPRDTRSAQHIADAISWLAFKADNTNTIKAREFQR
ncbi:hypothetical protein BASA61_000870 [Batrachochytrium salamandrivorans]|nr:hypothetical protein BASA61_000870 [Batrachochytrium salamandrivorans]KAH9275066.1 hypothetical protein BASA83_002287 [Batrachochytrium salamandrivorans]